MIERDFTSGSITRNLWRLAIPMIVSNLLHNSFSFVDMIFVGKLGPDAIAAVAMSGLFLNTILTIALGLSIGTVATIAHYTGAGKPEAVENVTIQSLILCVIASPIIGCISYPLAGDILRLLGASPEVVLNGIPYLRVAFLGLLFTMFFPVTLGAALRGAGDAVTPMKMQVGATLFNIALDPLLIFGLWGFPKLGIIGSALVTLITRGGGGVYLLWKCFNGRGIFTLHLRNVRFDWRTMKTILNIGIFGSIQSILRNLSGFVVMRIVAIHSTATVASFGIGIRIETLLMVPGFGIGNAVATLVGQNLGAGQPERAEQTAKRAMVSVLLIMTVMGIFCLLFATPLIRIFNTDPEVVQQGILYLYVTAGAFGFIGISIILGRAFNGAGDTISPTVITGIALFLLRIPLVLSGAYLWQAFGLFLGIAVSTVLQGLLMIFWFRRGGWKYKKINA